MTGVRNAAILAGMRLVLPLALVLAGVVASPAAADGVPDGMAGISADYSVVNLAEFPELLLVTYPARCDWATGQAWGLSPGGGPEGIPDYDVITDGVHAASGYCKESMVYALERGRWTIEPRPPKPTPDSDEMPLPIRELEAMTPAERARLFGEGEDPRVRATGRQLQPARWLVPRGERLRHVHDVLRVERAGEGFALRRAAVRYTYDDDSVEEVPSLTGDRPPPTGRGEPPQMSPASMVSAIPRWPFIAGGALVFVVMALLGLRRRR